MRANSGLLKAMIAIELKYPMTDILNRKGKRSRDYSKNSCIFSSSSLHCRWSQSPLSLYSHSYTDYMERLCALFQTPWQWTICLFPDTFLISTGRWYLKWNKFASANSVCVCVRPLERHWDAWWSDWRERQFLTNSSVKMNGSTVSLVLPCLASQITSSHLIIIAPHGHSQ